LLVRFSLNFDQSLRWLLAACVIALFPPPDSGRRRTVGFFDVSRPLLGLKQPHVGTPPGCHSSPPDSPIHRPLSFLIDVCLVSLPFEVASMYAFLDPCAGGRPSEKFLKFPSCFGWPGRYSPADDHDFSCPTNFCSVTVIDGLTLLVFLQVEMVS